MWCSVLQCAAVCCRVGQCVATQFADCGRRAKANHVSSPPCNYVHTSIYSYLLIFVYTYILIHICIHIYIYIYIYIHIRHAVMIFVSYARIIIICTFVHFVAWDLAPLYIYIYIHSYIHIHIHLHSYSPRCNDIRIIRMHHHYAYLRTLCRMGSRSIIYIHIYSCIYSYTYTYTFIFATL